MQAIAELSGRSCYICCGLVGVARFVHAQARTRRQGKQALHTRRGLLTVLRALRKRGSRDAPPLCVAARAAAIEAAPLLPKHRARHLRTERFTRSRRRSVGRPEACTARAHARHEGHSQGGHAWAQTDAPGARLSVGACKAACTKRAAAAWLGLSRAQSPGVRVWRLPIAFTTVGRRRRRRQQNASNGARAVSARQHAPRALGGGAAPLATIKPYGLPQSSWR